MRSLDQSIMEITWMFRDDPFLAQHIERYGNSGRANPSYLSSTICEEFVLLMAEEVKQGIINEMASAKYLFV